MNAKLRQIDERAEILANDLKHGRITRAKYEAALRKLVDRAEAILARMAA